MKLTLLLIFFVTLLAEGNVVAQQIDRDPFEYSVDSEAYRRAYLYYQLEDYDTAIVYINQALAIDPAHPDYLELKAYIFAYMGAQDSAIALSTINLTKDPTNAVFYDIRGTSYYFLGDFPKAAADYEKLLKLSPDHTRYFYNYMYMSNQQKADDKIIELYDLYTRNKSKIEEKEFAGDIHFYTSLAYGRKEDYKKAIELLNDALEVVAPQKPVSYLRNRSAYYTFLGDVKNASRDIDTLLVIDPDGAIHYQSKGEILISQGKYPEAQGYLLRSRSLGNTDVSLALELAENYFELKNIDSSIYYYSIVMDSIPDNAIIMNNYAYTLLEDNQASQAQNYFTKAQAQSPEEIDYIVGLIVSNYRLGDKDETRRWINYLRTHTDYKFSPSLLKRLEKIDYLYSDGIKKSWREITSDRTYRR